MITLELANERCLRWAQEMVTQYHYLRTPVDDRCSVEAYLIHLEQFPRPAGCLIFGRPEATRVKGWYGSLEDVASGKCVLSYWSVLNLARVWIDPAFQRGGQCWYDPLPALPGYLDRKKVWRSTLASEAIRVAVQRIGYEYLLRRPPVFPEQPYQIEHLLSYCDVRRHKGTIYEAAGFERYREANADGKETWRIGLPALTPEQDTHIRRLAEQHPRSRRYRAQRAALAKVQQASLFEEVSDG